MKEFKSRIILRCVCFGFAISVLNSSGSAQQTIVIQPGKKFQTIKGFGVSLCWWANIMGGWGDSAMNVVTKDLAGKDELNFNYFRFNIGGGDDPAHP